MFYTLVLQFYLKKGKRKKEEKSNSASIMMSVVEKETFSQ